MRNQKNTILVCECFQSNTSNHRIHQSPNTFNAFNGVLVFVYAQRFLSLKHYPIHTHTHKIFTNCVRYDCIRVRGSLQLLRPHFKNNSCSMHYWLKGLLLVFQWRTKCLDAWIRSLQIQVFFIHILSVFNWTYKFKKRQIVFIKSIKCLFLSKLI